MVRQLGGHVTFHVILSFFPITEPLCCKSWIYFWNSHIQLGSKFVHKDLQIVSAVVSLHWIKVFHRNQKPILCIGLTALYWNVSDLIYKHCKPVLAKYAWTQHTMTHNFNEFWWLVSIILNRVVFIQYHLKQNFQVWTTFMVQASLEWLCKVLHV